MRNLIHLDQNTILLHYEQPRPLRSSGTDLLSVQTKHGEAAFSF